VISGSGFPATSALRPTKKENRDTRTARYALRGVEKHLSYLGSFFSFFLEFKEPKKDVGLLGHAAARQRMIQIRRKSEKFVASFCYFVLHNAMFHPCCEVVLWGNKPDVGRG
jgi:hypothetical protein